MAARLSPGAAGLELLENTLATVAGLAVIIAVLAPVSGAHLNPVVSAADWALGRRSGTGLPRPGRRGLRGGADRRCGIGGAVLANLMFALPAVSASRTARSAPHLWLGEVVATAGLVLVVFALARSGRAALAPVAVAGWIGAAYWATSSTSFANPAVTIGAGVHRHVQPASRPDRCRGSSSAQAVGGGAGPGPGAGPLPGCPASGARASPQPDRCERRRRPGQSRPPGADGRAAAGWRTFPRCCSCAPTTRAGRRWRRRCWHREARRRGAGHLGRVGACQPGESGRGGGDGRNRGGHLAGGTQAARGRAGRSRGHRDLDGLRGRLPGVPRQALPGVGTAGPGRAERRAGPPDPRRHRRPGPRAAQRAG